MKAVRTMALALAALAAPSLGAQSIVTKEIRYQAGSQELVGYLAYDSARSGKLPGVLVVHEWQGINAYAKTRAEDLAREGYVGFALDMYGGGREVPMAEARTLSGQVGSDFPLIQARFNAALEVLKAQPQVDTTKIAAIGYCFGGGIVLNAARMGADLKGVVSFHGSVNTGLTAKKGDIRIPILAIQGEGDPATPVARRDALSQEMKDAGADFEFIVYPGVNAHNFTNPQGSTYYAKEASMAWDSMKAFFQKILK